jgi:hypothetical protein
MLGCGPLSHNSTILSTQGYGNGFVSKADRFKIIPVDYEMDPNLNLGPG